MGRLVYNHQGSHVELDDRVLAHLQVVMGSKLRRGEPFFFSWRNDVSVGSGRNSVWINPTTPLAFRYAGSRASTLNAAWIANLSRAANTPTGLYVVPEPDPAAASSSDGSSDGNLSHARPV